MIVGTPGRLAELSRSGVLLSHTCAVLVLDEVPSPTPSRHLLELPEAPLVICILNSPHAHEPLQPCIVITLPLHWQPIRHPTS